MLSSEDAVPFQSSGSLAFKETAPETTELVWRDLLPRDAAAPGAHRLCPFPVRGSLEISFVQEQPSDRYFTAA